LTGIYHQFGMPGILMKNKYILDTNVLIYFSNGLLNKNPQISNIFNESFNISIITKIEYLGWAGFRGSSEQYNKAYEFINNSFIFYIDDEIAEETISLRQKTSIKTPDAIIAATAKINKLILVTSNEKDFLNTGIEIFNPLIK